MLDKTDDVDEDFIEVDGEADTVAQHRQSLFKEISSTVLNLVNSLAIE